MIGILPKDSLLPWAVGLFALIIPINLGATLVAIVVGCLLSLVMTPMAHSIGGIVLSNHTVLSWMTQLSDVPGFAWTRLENTVVMGMTTIGILALIPAYLTAHTAYRDSRDSKIDRYADSTEDYPIVHTPTLQES
jgi:uncharacterized protein (TIGR03546 family)